MDLWAQVGAAHQGGNREGVSPYNRPYLHTALHGSLALVRVHMKSLSARGTYVYVQLAGRDVRPAPLFVAGWLCYMRWFGPVVGCLSDYYFAQ